MNWVEGFIFFLKPVDTGSLCTDPGTVGSLVEFHTTVNIPGLTGSGIAIVGVTNGQHSPNLPGPADTIRKYLYSQFYHGNNTQIYDLGNLVFGNSIVDNERAMYEVLSPLISRGMCVILIGADQEMTYANYRAYDVLETPVNLAVIDSRIDMGEFREELSERNYLSKIVLHDPGFLFNLSVLGYQTYLNDPETIALLEKLYFDVYRLGSITADIRDAEPVLRNADIVSIDLKAVRNADAPGTLEPNGLTGEQICQLCKYIGLSERTTSVGIYGYDRVNDIHGQAGRLIAQMIWYILDGFGRRVKEYPLIHKKDFLEYKVVMPGGHDEMVFYKSTITDKWWMNVPYATKSSAGRTRPFILPCSYKDYEQSCLGEVPDIYWKTYQKLV